MVFLKHWILFNQFVERELIMKIIFSILFLLVTFEVIPAQVTQDWQATYNGPGNSSDYPYSMTLDSIGNVYVTGYSFGIGTNADYATIKYNSAGIQQWVSRYNGTGNDVDEASSIVVDVSGNVYVTGRSYGIGAFDDYATIKYNSAGVQQWVARYNGPGNASDFASSVIVDIAGNVYVTGYSFDIGGVSGYATIKYNPDGVQEWVSRYNGPANIGGYPSRIISDDSGNVFVTGYSYGIGTSQDYTTIKYNSSGSELWVARYNGPGNSGDLATSITMDSTGNLFVTGYSTGIGTHFDYATIKYNTTGAEQWVARYNGTGNSVDVSASIASDKSGNIYVSGATTGIGTSFDYGTIKYNSAGAEQWVARYNGPGNTGDNATSIVTDNSGNIYVTGLSGGIGTGYDYATIKYNTAGILQWIERFNGTGNSNDAASSISSDGLRNVYITGQGNGANYCTVKYSQDIPLPVEISSFTSVVSIRDVELNWTTTSEVNNFKFEIQRIVSRSGSIVNEQWPVINSVEGNGTTSSPNNYIYIDKGLNSGKYIYRLKQIDFNGNYEYFSLNNEVVIGVPDKNELSQNYPNPFNPVTHLGFGISDPGFVSLKVYDVLGNEIKTLVNEIKPAGYYDVEFNGSGLPSGIYYYKLEAGTFNQVKKMMIIK